MEDIFINSRNKSTIKTSKSWSATINLKHFNKIILYKNQQEVKNAPSRV